MAIQSIWTAVQIRHMAGDHFLVPSRKVPFGEMDSVGELDYLAEKIRPCSKAFDDAGNLSPA